MMKIPLSRPFWEKAEEEAVQKALRTTLGTGDGPNSEELSHQLKELTGAGFAIAVTSCTHGLELVMASLGIGSGDEVILPSFTMSSTANAVVLAGATPVFADIDPVFANIDPADVGKRITSRTRGIIVVHYAGMAAPMEMITNLARRHGLFVVEDAAHAIGASYQGRQLGAWSDAGVYSFHGTKNVSCGEGGAVITSREDLSRFMDVYRANGTNRKAYLEGIVDKYSWVDRGTSFFLSDILAALAVSQMKKLGEISRKRSQVAGFYTDFFRKFEPALILPQVPEGSDPNWHIYALRLPTPQQRTVFIREMRKRGVEVSYHYVPLHSAPMGAKLAKGKPVRLPVTDLISRTLVRLPIYPGLTNQEMEYIAASARGILDRIL